MIRHYLMLPCEFCRCDCFHIRIVDGKRWLACHLCERIVPRAALPISGHKDLLKFPKTSLELHHITGADGLQYLQRRSA
jgi:hypothetical protein